MEGGRIRRWGALVGTVWAGLVLAYTVGYLTTIEPSGSEVMLAIFACLAVILVPLGLIWLVANMADQLAARQAWGEALDAEINTLRDELEAANHRLRTVEAGLRDLREAAAEAAAVIRMPPEPTPAPPPMPDPEPEPEPELFIELEDPQPALPLKGGSNASGPLSLIDTIQALNFPQNAQDEAGFAVLRRALQSHDLAKLLQASEDCLNLLAHQGIYMDDLMPAPASADDWRQFAKGGAARAELMPLNGITDGEMLEKVRQAMRSDPIFRDTALYFQRRFDQMLQASAPEAGNDELLRLVDTRSGRAFVLLVQVGGMSDPARG